MDGGESKPRSRSELAQNSLVLEGLAAVSWGEGRLDLFWIGDDGALWHRAWSAGRWLADERLGGEPASTPAGV